MSPPVKHLLLVFSSLTIASACSNDPCEENPDLFVCGVEAGDDTGETGEKEPEPGYCAPFSEDDPPTGYTYACQGQGNGWLSLTVFGEGTLPPECVNWGPEGKPEGAATVEDCAPLDLTMLPNDIPSPMACCTDDAPLSAVGIQCAEDCAFAACKLAIAKLRAAADALPEEGVGEIEKNAQIRVKGDLEAFAALLETPAALGHCADLVEQAGGETAYLDLGEGMSDKLLLGHVENATLALQCTLDELEPVAYVGDSCDAPANIPITEHESSLGGVAALGAVTVFGPEGDELIPIHDVSFAFTETRQRDGAIDLTLTEFSANAQTSAYGSFVFGDPSVHLAAPASGRVSGETVSFPPGALRLRVSAAVSVDGELLFDGEPMTGEYVNTETAIAVRSFDGSLSFVEAPFEVGGYRLVLNTEAAAVELR